MPFIVEMKQRGNKGEGMTHYATARDWLDAQVETVFPQFASEAINDMHDAEIEKLYQLIKKYKHRLLKEQKSKGSE